MGCSTTTCSATAAVLPELEPLLALVQYGTQEPLIVHARVDPRAEHSDRPALCAVATACEVLHEDSSSAAGISRAKAPLIKVRKQVCPMRQLMAYWLARSL